MRSIEVFLGEKLANLICRLFGGRGTGLGGVDDAGEVKDIVALLDLRKLGC